MMIDAHQHFWHLARGDYRFPAANDPVLYRDFMPDELLPILAASGVDATVLVQATDTLEETTFLLRLAGETAFVAGVVGWWDPREPGLLDRLLALPGHERLVGVRPMLQNWDDVSWLLEAPALAELERIGADGMVFDALVDARHLDTIRAVCDRVPSLKVAVNHVGKPWRRPDLFAQWTENMRALAQTPNCWVKVSGFPFSAKGSDPHSHPGRIVETLKEWFGVGRLAWGSDWPVVDREGGYGAALRHMTELFGKEERAAVFGGNAVLLYDLGL